MPRPTKWIELFHEFIQNLRIYSKEENSDKSGSPLVLYDSQERFLDEMAKGLEEGVRSFCCLKSRQLGITTISLVIDVFWCAMFPGTRAALVSDTEENRNANRSIINGYIQSFPQGYFGESFRVVNSNRSFMEFSNGSRITFLVAGTKRKGLSWAEGKGFSFAHLTECSKYGDPDALKSFQESLAQKNPNRLFIYESTANGYNHFRKMWFAAKGDTATQRAFFIGWWASNTNRIEKTDKRFAMYGTYPPSGEERERVRMVRQQYNYVIKPEQLAWIRWKDADQTQDEHIFKQNQPWVEQDAFIQSGYSFFQTRIVNKDIQAMLAANETDSTEYIYKAYRYELGNDFWAIKLEELFDEEDRHRIELKVWEEPQPNGKYVIGCDPAYGRNDHKDKHAVEVWRCYADKMVQVAEYATSDVEVKHCAWVLAHLASAYRDCVVNVELSGPGRMIMMEWDHLRDLLKAEQFARFVADRKWDDALENARWYLYHRADNMGAGACYNFETNWKTKSEIMHQFRGAYATRELHIRSRMLLEEMMIVVQDGNEIGAPDSSNEKCKDDRVFASALSVRAWINWRRPSLIAANETYERMTQEESGDTKQFGRRANDIVYRFFKRADELADMPAPRGPTWKIERNLI
jgi:hypothetical protein